ncbi:hypothetical protein LZK82_31155 (plasmid) [Rhizobium leguminosarum]|nr:hypothetical protein LZK82_31155 [Rhizobium leguminosarum]UIK14487.1 hypothetical protein LZK80_36835 [Rhizobium leguminosarum]UIL31411.1 hypothetical protein LZK75_37060 [Rhizobium leguminosarum]
MSKTFPASIATASPSTSRRRRKRPSLARVPQYRVVPHQRQGDGWLCGLIPEDFISDNGPPYFAFPDAVWLSATDGSSLFEDRQDPHHERTTDESAFIKPVNDEEPSDEH